MDNKKIKQKSKKPELKKSKTAHNRFLKTAPSLVALLGIASDPTYRNKSEKVILDDLILSNHSKKANKKNDGKKSKKNKKTTKKKTPKKKTSIDKKKTFSAETEQKEAELASLKKQAQAELQRLADENDDLFHEKEILRLKYDDLQHEIKLLQANNTNNDIFQQENDRLKLIIENYKSELSTLQTECIMLREHLHAKNDNFTAENEQNESYENEQNERMDAIKKLVQEKNDILTEFDELKVHYNTSKKETEMIKKQLVGLEEECDRLRVELEHERSENLENNIRQTDRINDLNKKMELSKDELLLEYEKKEQQFIQTVEEQLKYIDELENENQEFQRHHTRKSSLSNQAGDGMYSLLRLKTQANIYSARKDTNQSSTFDDDYEFAMDEDYDEANDSNGVSPVDTFIEYDDDDVGDALMISTSSIYSTIIHPVGDAYGRVSSPNRDAMSSYLEMMKASQYNKQQMLDVKQQEEERKKQQENMEKVKAEKEKILAAQKQHTKLEDKHLESLVGKMKDVPIEQTSIRALGYFINKNGKLLPIKEENKQDVEQDDDGKDKQDEKEEDVDVGLLSWNLDEHTYGQLTKAITIYLFDTLLKYYNFRPKQIGKMSGKKRIKNKKNQIIQIDYQYKTLLFSSNFKNVDTLFVMIPPYRAGVCYWNLCVDKGIVYGTLLSYIEFALSLNNGKCGILLLDPKGLDANATPWSIFKIYDKFISKRVREKKIKKIVFIGALKEGNLISHLLDRRGKELKDVVKACIFLGCDDPYTARECTAKIYEKCAVNYINSKNEIGTVEVGAKSNGDKYYIPRKSAGMDMFCAISAYPNVTETVKKALL